MPAHSEQFRGPLRYGEKSRRPKGALGRPLRGLKSFTSPSIQRRAQLQSLGARLSFPVLFRSRQNYIVRKVKGHFVESLEAADDDLLIIDSF